MKQDKFLEAIKTASLVVIAVTLMNINIAYRDRQQSPVAVNANSRVVEVVGRASMPFNSLGTEVGFLVKDGDRLLLIGYDQGSMASRPEFKPAYLHITDNEQGQKSYPIQIEQAYRP